MAWTGTLLLLGASIALFVASFLGRERDAGVRRSAPIEPLEAVQPKRCPYCHHAMPGAVQPPAARPGSGP